MIAVGFSGFALSLWLFSGVTDNWGFAELFWPQVIRGLSLLLCIVPATGMALNGVEPQDLRYASGLFNLNRNLGGAVGIAVVNTWLIDFSREQASRLSAAMGEAPDRGREALQGLTQLAQGWTPDASRALAMAESVMGRIVGREAATLAFADTYRLMAWMFLLALIIVPFAKPAPYIAGPPPSEH